LGPNGLAGVSQLSGGQPAYIAQIENEAANSSANAGTLGSNLSSSLSQYISNANEIQSYASSSLSLAQGAQNAVGNAMTYCQTASDTPVVSDINVAIATTTALVTQLQGEYTNDTNTLNSLTSMNNQALAATSTDALNTLTQQYNSLLSAQSLPSPTDIQNAKTENGNVQTQATLLTVQAAEYTRQCQLYAGQGNLSP
jgi:hypothetical protein